MKKDYKNWMQVKAEINDKLPRPIGFKERQIWFCNVGENIGFEEDGKGARFVRPVLILKRYGNQMCHVIPLSTTTKRNDLYYYPFDGKTGKTSVALLSQSRVIDSARLHRKIGLMEKEDFNNIKERIRTLFNL